MWEQFVQCGRTACDSPTAPQHNPDTLPPPPSDTTHPWHHRPDWIDAWSGLEPGAYERKKEEVADAILARLERVFPGITAGTLFRCVCVRGPGGGAVGGLEPANCC